MQNHAPTIYAYADVEALLHAEERGGHKSPLPGPGSRPVTERPEARIAPGVVHDATEMRADRMS